MSMLPNTQRAVLDEPSLDTPVYVCESSVSEKSYAECVSVYVCVSECHLILPTHCTALCMCQFCHI